jgi:hypothetical protein
MPAMNDRQELDVVELYRRIDAVAYRIALFSAMTEYQISLPLTLRPPLHFCSALLVRSLPCLPVLLRDELRCLEAYICRGRSTPGDIFLF